MILGRYSGDTDLRTRILEMLTAGRPSDELIELLPGFGTWRYPEAHYAIDYPGVDRVRRRVGSDIATELLDRFEGPDTPWERARVEGATRHGWSELPRDLRAAATGHGLHDCMVVPVPLADDSAVAVAVAWSADPCQSVSAHRYALEQMAGALDLVLQWRGHLTDLEQAARVDALSGVANRNTFIRQFETSLARAASTGESIAVFYVDLDNFKDVNDEFGHAVGDSVIVDAAARMCGLVRSDDLVGRIGGDECAVLCPGVANPDEVTTLADRLVGALAEPFACDGHELRLGASVGVTVAEAGSGDHSTLLAKADRALYQAKAAGRGRWHLA